MTNTNYFFKINKLVKNLNILKKNFLPVSAVNVPESSAHVRIISVCKGLFA